MKKLLTFAGVSALALITAAPDAFGAAQNATEAYGTFSPTCASLAGSITVKFYGYNTSTGQFSSDPIYTTTINPSTSNPAWATGTGALTIAQLETPVSKSVTLSGATYASGLKPRGAVLYSIGNFAPTSTVYTSNAGMVVSRTTAAWNPLAMIGSNGLGDYTTRLSFAFGDDNDGFPAVTSSDITYIKQSNTNVMNYVIAYAAECVESSTTECTLQIKNGGAYYKNFCLAGNTATNFGETTYQCDGAGKCGSMTTKYQKTADQKSKDPEWLTEQG